MDDRIKRISKRLDVTESKAKDIIKKKDKERSCYYNYCTSKNGEAHAAMICVKIHLFQWVDFVSKMKRIYFFIYL